LKVALLTQEVQPAKPFLRWAGGKKWLTSFINNLLKKEDFKNYHEPFLGGGAVFFAVTPTKKSFLSDLNGELIETYNTVKNSPNDLIKVLKTFHNTEDFYYKIRSKLFDDPIKSAARFIYLNQTSFNGIYRVNLKGVYNVPYGYRTKDFIAESSLIKASKCLKNTNLFQGDFDMVRKNIKKGDVVFLDPPYTVSHNDNGFIKYNQHLFSLEDQQRLSALIDFIKSQGAFYILSNAAHNTIAEIFEKNDYRVELSRASLIGGTNAKRGAITEYIFTNIKP
jgi:DNA adenine methylase